MLYLFRKEISRSSGAILYSPERFQRVRKNFIRSVFGTGSDSEVKLGITSLGNSRLSKGNIYIFPLQVSSATLTSKCMLRHSKRGQDCSVPNYGPQSLSFFFFSFNIFIGV